MYICLKNCRYFWTSSSQCRYFWTSSSQTVCMVIISHTKCTLSALPNVWDPRSTKRPKHVEPGLRPRMKIALSSLPNVWNPRNPDWGPDWEKINQHIENAFYFITNLVCFWISSREKTARIIIMSNWLSTKIVKFVSGGSNFWSQDGAVLTICW